MASDIIVMSFQLGLFPSIEEFKPTERTILIKKVKTKKGYRIAYSKKEDLLFLNDIFPDKEGELAQFCSKMVSRATSLLPKQLLEDGSNMFHQEIKKEFGNEIHSNYRNLSASRLIQVLKKIGTKSIQLSFIENLIEEKIMVMRIKEIKKIESTNPYVFDVEIPSTQMFCGGIGPILLHNTGGGILSGIKAGRACAKAIDEFYKNKKPLAQYSNYLAELNKELNLHWKIRKYMNSLSEQKIDSLFEKMKKSGTEEFLSEFGDMDRPSKFVGKIMTTPHMWRLVPDFLAFMRK